MIGTIDLTEVHRVTTKDLAFVVIGGAMALALGNACGASVQLLQKNGRLWQRYRRRTLALWALLVGTRVVLAAIAHVAHAPLGAGTQTILLGLGLSLLGEAAVVGTRAMFTGVPFAPDP